MFRWTVESSKHQEPLTQCHSVTSQLIFFCSVADHPLLLPGIPGAIWPTAAARSDVLLLSRQGQTKVCMVTQPHPHNAWEFLKICQKTAEKKVWEKQRRSDSRSKHHGSIATPVSIICWIVRQQRSLFGTTATGPLFTQANSSTSLSSTETYMFQS